MTETKSAADVAPPTRPTLTGRGVVVFLVVAAAVVGLALVLPPLADHLHQRAAGSFLGDVVKGWSLTVLHPAYWIFLAVLMAAEWRWPACTGEGLLSVGGAQDLAWLLLAPLFGLTIVAAYLSVLEWVYVHPLHSVALDVNAVLGTVITAVLAFLLADFFMWLSHFIRHKVKPLWRFHQVHHSQEQMSALTDNRVHFFESLVSATIAYIPARLLGLGDEAAVFLAFATVYFTGFTHANLRTHLGPLRYLLVTPQSHRIHHSTEMPHWDHNFGAVLSVWDRIFGTQWRGAHEYPTVGLPGEDFPHERSARPSAVLATYVRQLAYPVQALRQDLRRSPADPSRPPVPPTSPSEGGSRGAGGRTR